jgi:hypothetical protein
VTVFTGHPAGGAAVKPVLVALALGTALAAIVVCGAYLASGFRGYDFSEHPLSWVGLVPPEETECMAQARRRQRWCLGYWEWLGEMPPYGLKDQCTRVLRKTHEACEK